jgi:hypothetical protein
LKGFNNDKKNTVQIVGRIIQKSMVNQTKINSDISVMIAKKHFSGAILLTKDFKSKNGLKNGFVKDILFDKLLVKHNGVKVN